MKKKEKQNVSFLALRRASQGFAYLIRVQNLRP
jgi:hypothetical protein